MAQAAKLSNEEASRGGEPSAIGEFIERLKDYPRRLREFFHEVRIEMLKVNWPTRQDVVSTTLVVIVTVAFFGVFFALTDGLFSRGIGWLINYVKH
jgi:preprotein translocase subunit SecE